jgi:hypothetical protein
MRLVHRIVARTAGTVLLAAVAATTVAGSAEAARATVPQTADRIEVSLSAQETRLGAQGQGVGAYVCGSYVLPASAHVPFTVDPLWCEGVVDTCAASAYADHVLAVVTFYADAGQCGWAPMGQQSLGADARSNSGTSAMR